MSKYWSESDEANYRFVPVPRVLFTDFKDVSIQAKWVYAILLDRLMLSKKNVDRFSDEEGLFLYFKQNDLAELLGISPRTVTRIFEELKAKELIQAKMCGMGQPQKIYLAKPSEFVRQDKSVYTDKTNLSTRTRQKCLHGLDKNDTSDKTNLSSPIKSNTEKSNTERTKQNIFTATPKKRTPFVAPSVEEVQAYIDEKGYTFSAEEFVASNEQKGWVVGKNQTPMKNWKAACLIWEKNQKRFGVKDKPTPQDLDKKWGVLDYDGYMAAERKKQHGSESEGFGFESDAELPSGEWPPW